ncbi:MAG: MCE family protein [Burkholderiaceae bacterium]|nr:MCE family protein [Ideonella sp.]MCC7288521.1 MCE family protein [Burkholderiaceae bacterium]
MEPKARYTLVGTLVLALLAAIAASIVWLTATRSTHERVPYKVYFARQSLEGLEVRSDVRMRGIRVGSVRSFRFSTERPGTVEVTFGVDTGTPVLQSTRAVVDRNFITGLANIRLQNLTDDSPPLKPTENGEIAVIAEGSSQLEQFSDSVNQLAQRADETLRRINNTLSDKNVAAFGETLEQLRVATRGGAATIARFDRSLAALDGASDSVRQAAAGIDAGARRLSERYDQLGAQAATAVGDTAATVRQVRADLLQLSQRAERLLEVSDSEIRLTAQDLRAASDAVAVAARHFNDPRAVLFGPGSATLGPGEGKR